MNSLAPLTALTPERLETRAVLKRAAEAGRRLDAHLRELELASWRRERRTRLTRRIFTVILGFTKW